MSGEFQIKKTVTVGDPPVLTNVTSFVLVLTRNDTQAVVPTTMTNPSTGLYEWTYQPCGATSYNAAFTMTLNGSETVWTDTIYGCSEECIEYPCLTGHVLWDTLQAKLFQRLILVRKGPSPDVSIHGHNFKMQQFMDHLDRSILHLRLELSQAFPYEVVSGDGGYDGGCW